MNTQISTVQLFRKAAKYYPLSGGGSDPKAFQKAFVEGYKEALKDLKNAPKDEFFVSLAEALRQLWPPGEKDGKYPWRESVVNLSRRLALLWDVRKLKQYSIDECLTVARKYVNQFEDNTKYMRTLKYFVLKEKPVRAADGKASYTHESVFADMLENNLINQMDEIPSDMFDLNSIDSGGELI